jgi:hypothetical protein
VIHILIKGVMKLSTVHNSSECALPNLDRIQILVCASLLKLDLARITATFRISYEIYYNVHNAFSVPCYLNVEIQLNQHVINYICVPKLIISSQGKLPTYHYYGNKRTVYLLYRDFQKNNLWESELLMGFSSGDWEKYNEDTTMPILHGAF